MAKKPANLLYGVNDRPPWTVLAILSVQHVFVMSSTLVLSVVLVSEIGGSKDQVQATVALTMIASGLGTIIQALRWRGIGSGYLCPNLCGPNFFSVSIGAAWLGGLPLMRGMTMAAGLVEVVFGKLLRRLEFLFPTEITGMVVFMVAFGLVPLGASKFLGINYSGDPILPTNFAIAALTLLVMVGVNVWGSGKLKLYGVLIGMATGYVLSIATGLLAAVDFYAVADAAWIGLPHYPGMWQFSFRWTLLPAFAIISICGALKSFGNLVMCEKANDEEWSEPDIRRVGDGLTADGLAVFASGLLGGVASDTSASNVALSIASGATSRWIGFGAGGLFLLLGFSPKLSAILSVMPASVAGAILVFVVCFMMMSGVQIILSSRMDTPKIFVMGVALTFGISLDITPALYAQVYPWLRPLFESSLTLSTVVAVLLNQLLRLGGKKAGATGETLAEG